MKPAGHSSFTGRLGLIQCFVGAFDQRVTVVGVGGSGRCPITCTNLKLNALKAKRLAQGTNEPPAQKLNFIVPDDVVLNNGELVTAQTVSNVVPANIGRNSAGDGPKQPVADGMAVRVIDPLESVQIDKVERDRGLAGSASNNRSLKILTQRQSVGKARKVVNSGDARQMTLGFKV